MYLKNLLVALLLFGFSLTGYASEAVCIDSLNITSINKTASSSITYDNLSSVSASKCGPYLGNDSNSLTSALGGYGYSDWVQLDKYDVDTSTGGGIITGSGWGGTSGMFSFSELLNYTGDYLIALKFGNVYSTFLSDSAANNWGWNTDYDGDNKYALSHLTVYTRGGTSVPEASTIVLFGFGLLGLLVARRRST